MSETSAMIERAAKAMVEAQATANSALVKPLRWDDMRQADRNLFLFLAQAGMEVLRKPTEAMRQAGMEAMTNSSMTAAGWLNVDADDFGKGFEAAIDAALSPPQIPGEQS